MDYNQLLANFDVLNKRIADAHAEMRNTSKGLIEQAVKIFLDTCPEVTGVHWTQYTPYFNDGESCEFGVNEYCFHILEEDEEIEMSYESTVLYDSSDLQVALLGLENAKAYTADRAAWQQQYLKDWLTKHGRAWTGRYPDEIKPYPHDPAKAQVWIDEVLALMEKIPADVADRINNSFKALRSALARVPDNVMESVYGDHSLVVINRGGTEIEEHTHD